MIFMIHICSSWNPNLDFDHKHTCAESPSASLWQCLSAAASLHSFLTCIHWSPLVCDWNGSFGRSFNMITLRIHQVVNWSKTSFGRMNSLRSIMFKAMKSTSPVIVLPDPRVSLKPVHHIGCQSPVLTSFHDTPGLLAVLGLQVCNVKGGSVRILFLYNKCICHRISSNIIFKTPRWFWSPQLSKIH